MSNYKKKYIKHKGYAYDDYIGCENCGNRAVDVHHIIFKSHCFGEDRDDVKNLIALCRECHDLAHSSKKFNDKLKTIKHEN